MVSSLAISMVGALAKVSDIQAIEKALNELQKPIYTISKTDNFFLKNGFTYDTADLIGKECKTCDEYNITCFPKVMMYK